MTTTAVIGRPEAPSGPPKLTPALLREAQQQTVAAPRLRCSVSARALFKTMDLGYGRAGTIVKFIILEYVARVPYQAWERVGYLACSRSRFQPHRLCPRQGPGPGCQASGELSMSAPDTVSWPVVGLIATLPVPRAPAKIPVLACPSTS